MTPQQMKNKDQQMKPTIKFNYGYTQQGKS